MKAGVSIGSRLASSSVSKSTLYLRRPTISVSVCWSWRGASCGPWTS